MIAVDDHWQHEFKISRYHSSKGSLGYALLILSQEVLKALIKDGLNLIDLEKLLIPIKELIESLIKSL
jgi:hypothetical protein